MLILFISKPDFACNPYALWKYITENTEHETAWLVSEKSHLEVLRSRGIICELYDTYRGNLLASKAKYVISNVYVFGAIPKKEGQIFVNLWHGSGIKAHDFYDYHLHQQQKNKVLEFSEKTDLMCVHSLDDRFRLSAMLHYDLRKSYVTGQPRLDCVESSDGLGKLAQIYGEDIKKYKKYILFVPSFRANSSHHSGKFYSDNIFRLDDYRDSELEVFLEQNNAALIYKLHPIEQTALKGVGFSMNKYCYSLTDEMLFQADIRYDEILNAFDLMISDYSSIAFDFLLLNRPIVYLIPDYDEYRSQKGFVFYNIDQYMPGDKAYHFSELLSAMEEAVRCPWKYEHEREFVLSQRFEYRDRHSAKRCYEMLVSYKPLCNKVRSQTARVLPTNAELLSRYLTDDVKILDSTDQSIASKKIADDQKYWYIQGELPDEYRAISQFSSTQIADLEFYHTLEFSNNIEKVLIHGGVDYEMFADRRALDKTDRKTIGFAGTIDCRIYFAMVQYLCEAFPNCDIVFAGDIIGNYPAWLDGYRNLHYMGQVAYENLPDLIHSFDVAILPFYGKYQSDVPTELFQYLACGKQVIASDMSEIPKCKAIYVSKSVADAVENVKEALKHLDDEDVRKEARLIAKKYDWRLIAKNIDDYIVR